MIQQLFIGMGSFAIGRSLDAEVWHDRFEQWGLVLLTSPAYLLFLVYVIKTLLCPKEKQKTFDTIFLCLTYILWFAFVGYTALRHEPWKDELLVYIKARDLSAGGLLADVQVDGNFALWSLFISLFAKTGGPVEVLTAAAFCLCAVFVMFFLVKAPFSIYEKASFVFTTAVFYFYPVVARPYVIFALLTVLLASCWKKRTEHPILVGIMIALLAHTHLYAEGFVGILTLSVLVADIILPWRNLDREKRKWRLAGLAIACLGILLAAVLVLPAVWKSGVVSSSVGHRMDLNLKGFFANWIWQDLSKAGIPVVCLFVGLYIFLLFQDKGLFLIFSVAFAYMVLFHVFIFPASVPNRGGMWIFMLVFVFWNIRKRQEKNSVPAYLLLLLFITATNPSWNLRDWKEEYSGEKKLCEYIQKNFSADETIYLSGSALPESYIPSLPAAYIPSYDLRMLPPLYVTSDDVDRAIDGLFQTDSSDSLVLVLAKPRIGSYPYPASHRWDSLYESSEIMAQIFQYSVMRVYR